MNACSSKCQTTPDAGASSRAFRRFGTGLYARLMPLVLSTVLTAAGTGTLHAQQLPDPVWSLDPDESTPTMSLENTETPLALRGSIDPLPRPRLNVSLVPGGNTDFAGVRSQFSWSLEAWEMNTASLAHIQCSRATRTIERFLVEDCRFVDQPLPENPTNLVQLSGQWMATPALGAIGVGAGVYSGRQPVAARLNPISGTSGPSSHSLLPGSEQVDGFNVNLSFALDTRKIGTLLLDLQLDRYRERYSAPFSGELGAALPLVGLALDDTLQQRWSSDFRTAGELGIGWRGGQFGAEFTGQYRELPFWLGDQYDGEGHRSFDIEFSWRAPARSSFSVGVTNILDTRPGGVGNAAEQNVETAVDGIYGRIPYVRYKHDL